MDAIKNTQLVFDSSDSKITPKKSPTEIIKERQSQELILGFCGAVGSDIPSVTACLEQILKRDYSYEVKHIKVSKIIEKICKIHPDELQVEAKRYLALQDKGNELRKQRGNEFLGRVVAINIASFADRVDLKDGSSTHRKDLSVVKITSKTSRIAYLIDSFKHPEEVNLLRAIYGNIFYLFGILCANNIRLDRLRGKGIDDTNAAKIMERDQDEEEKYGQKLSDTLHYADFFIRNNHPNRETLKERLNRFLKLILNTKSVVTPTSDEYAMYMAQSTALKSACLSRQVGAAILNKDGILVSTGSNDVPKAGGGLYSVEDGENDLRCMNKDDARCWNNYYKENIKEQIKNILAIELASEKTDDIANNIALKTQIKDLLEFSRSVHAEMDAITAVARRGGIALQDGSLYTTLFPCHNCARHIIASGIKKVFYIEPYEKSLALDLYKDSIELDPPSPSDNKIIFQHFEGVAPRQYLNLFYAKDDRKKQGKLVPTESSGVMPAVPEYLATYIDFESKLIEHTHDEFKDEITNFILDEVI